MRALLALAAMLLTSQVQAADPPPEFPAAGVVLGAGSARILVPGAGGSIYGTHLAVGQGCVGKADPKVRETLNPRNPDPGFADLSIYPKELCGVLVLIGDKPAGLLFVSDKQINFKIPQDSPDTGTVELRVVRDGQSSAAVTFEAGFGKTTVALEQPAYIDMPVWLKVDLRFGLGQMGYPSPYGPGGFGCNQVEVRRDGQLLPMLPGSNWDLHGGGRSGPPCGSWGLPAGNRVVGRLPLHLVYRFDTPGTYEVRYTLWTGEQGMSGRRMRAQSDWTSIEILPSQPKQRADWLDALRKRSSTDVAELLTDTLPSALAVADDAAFDFVTGYLYHPDYSVRRYAMTVLSYWPEDSTSTKLLALLQSKGPSDELVYFMTRQPDYAAAHQTEIDTACLPYLESDSPVALGGVLSALRWPPPPPGSAAFEALLRAAEHIVARGDAQTGSYVLQTLAGPPTAPIRDPRVHALLRNLVDAGHGVAAEPLMTYHDRDDLPRLGALLAMPAKADRLAYSPAILYETFGNAAAPALEQALRASPGRFGERDIALQLMLAGDAVGFQWALRAIASKGPSRFDIMQALKSRFAELQSANDDAIAAFVRTRAGN